jgi:thioredoxin-like negative regulator of GroEL
MSTGRVSDACGRLLSIYPELTPEDRSLVRERLLSFFLIGGPTSDEVKRARSALTSLMF